MCITAGEATGAPRVGKGSIGSVHAAVKAVDLITAVGDGICHVYCCCFDEYASTIRLASLFSADPEHHDSCFLAPLFQHILHRRMQLISIQVC